MAAANKWMIDPNDAVMLLIDHHDPAILAIGALLDSQAGHGQRVTERPEIR